MKYKKIYPRLFWIIPMVFYVVFYILPSVMGFAYSMTDWTIYNKTKDFIGLQNYIHLFHEKRFMTGLTNTLLFATITTLFKCIIGFILAVALVSSIRTKNFLRAVFFLPMILSTLIVGVIYQSMLMPDSGLINQFFSLFGGSLGSTDWLGNKSTAMWWVIIVEIWRGSGYCMVIFIAGLQVISKDYYEAAKIDGANFWSSLKSITIPLMVPSFNINILLSIISGLKVFDLIIALTDGGPGMATQVLSTTIYSYMGSGALSAGCAANILLTLFVVLVMAVVNAVFSKLEVE